MPRAKPSNDRIGAVALLLLSFYWVWASAWPVASLTGALTTLTTTEGIAGRAVISAGVNSSLLGTDFQQGLVSSVVADTAAMGANAIGSTWGPSGTDPNATLQTLSHATLGYAQGALTAGNCASGAAGAAAESVLGHVIDAAGGLPSNGNGHNTTAGAALYATGAAALGAVAGQAAGGNAQSGADTAINAAVNNRLLHPDEQTTLSQLQQGQSPQEQYRLRAAACALAHCADSVSSNDPNKAALQKLQDDGQQYAAEQATLTAGGAFKYPLTDRLSDLSNGYQLPTRALGAAQGALGTVGAAGALVAGCDSVVACGLGISTAATSLDYAQAGYTQMLSGNPTPTYGEQVLQGLGMSPTGAALTYGGLSLAAGMGSALLPVGGGAATRPADSGIGANSVGTAGRSLVYENPSSLVQSRVDDFLSQIPVNSQGRITMGVAVIEDTNGVRSVLVSTSEPRGYLRPGVTLQPGETVIAGTGHAEADIVSYAKANGLKVIDIGATRPVCASCQNVIDPTGANVTTPLKSLKQPSKTSP